MKGKPLLYIDTVKTETILNSQIYFDSRYTEPKKNINNKIQKKVDLLVQRTGVNQPVICKIKTQNQNYRGIIINKKFSTVTIIDDSSVKHDINMADIEEIRVIKI